MTDVSVVILNYNYGRFLATTINSALDQTHPQTEVIVVDDASTDDSHVVIKQFGPAIRTVIHETNQGQGAAINSGAAAASGDVIWFLDADDALLPEACATAVEAFEADETLAKFHTPLAIIDAEGHWSGATLPAVADRLAVGDITDHVFAFRAHGWPPMSGNAYSAGCLTRVLPVPAEVYRQAADSFLNEQIAICGPIARSDRPVAAYRRHGRNQFAGKPTSLEWLRTKISREICSHERLGLVAWQLGLAGYRKDPDAVHDVAFAGYRMASLRLDPDGHPPIVDSRRDDRMHLARIGIGAAWANDQLAAADRLMRTIWFFVMAVAPGQAVERLLAWYMPDGPNEPIWRQRRRTRAGSDRHGTALVPSAGTENERGGCHRG